MTNKVKHMRFLLAGNSTYTNHGSEAIVRGTAVILRKFFNHPEIISAETQRFPYSNILETDPEIIHKPVFFPKPHSSRWFFNQLQKALFTRPVAYKRILRGLLSEIKKADCMLSIGGDAYRKQPFVHMAENELAMEAKIPVILWGASVEPFAGSLKYQKSVFDHLKRFNGIFVRETVSQNFLADNGVKDNVYLVEDPAFLMEPVEPADPQYSINLPKGAIGISLSSLFLNQTRFFENHKAAVYNIVEAVRQRFGRPIILIPHCVDFDDDDHALLNGTLQENRPKWSNVTCLPKFFSAAETKWVISRLYALVGARAHSTIAAFSSHVPTVSLVYSFKGEGFNKRLFNSLDYAVKKEQCEPETITKKLELIIDDYDNIRKILQDKMIEIEKGAMRAGQLLKEILKTNGTSK